MVLSDESVLDTSSLASDNISTASEAAFCAVLATWAVVCWAVWAVCSTVFWADEA